MFQAESQALEDQYEYIEQNITKLLDSLKGRHGTIVFVTNEVGMGIVPSNDLSRQYRDLAGIVNQKLASVATQVFLVVCGIPIDIKKLAKPYKEAGFSSKDISKILSIQYDVSKNDVYKELI